MSCLLLVLSAPSAFAFSYAEHCRMSNRAMWLAVRYVMSHRRQPISRADSTELLSLSHRATTSECDKRASSTAYGDLVARVDWALTPSDYFLSPLSSRSSISINDEPAASITSLLRLPQQSLRLLHENTEHFGVRALYLSRLWRRHAEGEASRGYLGAALAYNAFADHYAEDLFAPGHIFTPRLGLNDAVSGGMHAAYNRRGAHFFPKNTAQLWPLLGDSSAAVPDGGAMKDSLLSEACSGQAHSACVSALSTQAIVFYGDDDLGTQPKQELFVSLVVANSTVGLLTAWLDRAVPSQAIEGSRWCGYGETNDGWMSPFIETHFGGYQPESGSRLPATDSWITARVGYENRHGAHTSMLVSLEDMRWAKPAYWFGADTSASWLRRLRSDLVTSFGLDALLPTTGHLEQTAGGAFVRRTVNLGRTNIRTSFVGGARYEPSRSATEIHVDASAELGFGLAYLELRPGVVHRWNENRGWRATLVSSLSLTPPIGRKAHPVLPDPVRSATPQQCVGSEVLIP